MSLLDKIPVTFQKFVPLLELIPQISITATVLGMYVLFLFLSPESAYTVYPMMIFLVIYWIRLIKIRGN